MRGAGRHRPQWTHFLRQNRVQGGKSRYHLRRRHLPRVSGHQSAGTRSLFSHPQGSLFIHGRSIHGSGGYNDIYIYMCFPCTQITLILISSHLISSHLYRIGPLLTRARWCFAEQGRIGGAVVRGGASRGDSRPHDGRGVQMRQTGAGTTANTDKIACAGERKSTTYDGWKGGEKKKKKKGRKKKEVSPGLWGLYMCVICVI